MFLLKNVFMFKNKIYTRVSHSGKKPADICESNDTPNGESIHIDQHEKTAVEAESETETCKNQENPHKQDKRENAMNGNHFVERSVDTSRL